MKWIKGGRSLVVGAVARLWPLGKKKKKKKKKKNSQRARWVPSQPAAATAAA